MINAVKQMNIIEKRIHNFMELTLEKITCKLIPLKKVISPLVKNAIRNIPMHVEEIKNNNKLIRSGIMNSHLCVNAQTMIPHTESDTSYTIISVPNQDHYLAPKKQKQKTSFEFYINHDEVLVVPMYIGIIICYSGFLLTHRQHITNQSDENDPFLNVVSYNSKRLLSHILKSIQRNAESTK